MISMGIISSLVSCSLIVLLILPTPSTCYYNLTTHKTDVDLLEFPLNLEYLEAEFFLWGSLGKGLDQVAPDLAGGGPPPVGVTKANLDPFVRDIIIQFGVQEVGHVRAIKEAVSGFPRPQMDLGVGCFAKVMDEAVGRSLKPPFDPYATGLNYLLASYVIPYVGLTGYVGAIPQLAQPHSRRLVAGLLSVESAQDAIIRGMLYERAEEEVKPYGIKVAEFTNKISELRNRLGKSGIKDQGLVVTDQSQRRRGGVEAKTAGNVVAGDDNYIAFERTPREVLRIVYGNGNEHVPGGFYPKGASGRIAQSYLGTPRFA